MAALCAGPVGFHIPQAPGGRVFSFPSGAGRSLRTFFPSLRRRALAPLAWLRALRRAGAVASAGPLRGPVPLISHIARLPGARSARIARRRGRADRAAARPGPAHLPHRAVAGRSLRSNCAPARSRRPGRCAARSRSSPTPLGPPVSRAAGGLLSLSAPGGGEGRGEVGAFLSSHPFVAEPRRSRSAYAPCGAPAQSRRPGLAARFPSPPTPRRLAAPRVSCRMRQHTGNPAKTRLRWRMLRR